MFRYSTDLLIESKLRERDSRFIDNLYHENLKLYHSLIIEKEFDFKINSYELIENLNKIFDINKEEILLLVIIRNDIVQLAINDINKYLSTKIINKEQQIPYIEFSFPDEYECKYGQNYKDIYFFFFSKYNINDLEEKMIKYLNKLNNLKSFI